MKTGPNNVTPHDIKKTGNENKVPDSMTMNISDSVRLDNSDKNNSFTDLSKMKELVSKTTNKTDAKEQSHKTQKNRLDASIKDLLKRFPNPSKQRDQNIMLAFQREAVSSEDIMKHKNLLSDSNHKMTSSVYLTKEQVGENWHEDYRGHIYSPFEGMTLDQMAVMIDQQKEILDRIQGMTEKLPDKCSAFYRYTDAESNKLSDMEALNNDGVFDSYELFERRGMERFYTGIYVADNNVTSNNYGGVLSTITVSKDAVYFDNTGENKKKLEKIIEETGKKNEWSPESIFYTQITSDALLGKAGVDIARFDSEKEYYCINNPEIVENIQ